MPAYFKRKYAAIFIYSARCDYPSARKMCEILFLENAIIERNMNFGNCCIGAR
nr:MAG TPA: hypothetical protein [Bacteriophage sp.]